MLSLINSL